MDCKWKQTHGYLTAHLKCACKINQLTFLFLLELIEVKGFFLFFALLWGKVLKGFFLFCAPKMAFFSVNTELKCTHTCLHCGENIWTAPWNVVRRINIDAVSVAVAVDIRQILRPMLVFMQKRWPAEWCEVSGVDDLTVQGLVARLRQHVHGWVWLKCSYLLIILILFFFLKKRHLGLGSSQKKLNIVFGVKKFRLLSGKLPSRSNCKWLVSTHAVVALIAGTGRHAPSAPPTLRRSARKKK